MRSFIIFLMVVVASVTPVLAQEGEDGSGGGGITGLIIIGVIIWLAIAAFGNSEEKKGSITITKTETRIVDIKAKRKDDVDMGEVTRQIISGQNPRGFRLTENDPTENVKWRIDRE